MDSLHLELPDSVKAFVDERVAEGHYVSANEYVNDLILADQKRRAEARLDALLLEGLNSGDPIEAAAEYWETKKRALTAHASQTSGA